MCNRDHVDVRSKRFSFFHKDDMKKNKSVSTALLSSGFQNTIDIVYTWVDGSDSKWRDKKKEYAASSGVKLPRSDNDARYINNDELKYSLRSVWMYAPWVRNIFIVTEGHLPPWLDKSNEKIIHIHHEDIFPKRSFLPVFNSHAIEANLHRISGLSEYFVYFNDDVFIGREVLPDDFYTFKGLPRIRFSKSHYIPFRKLNKKDIPTDWAGYNAMKTIFSETGMIFNKKLEHVPHVLRRSILFEMEKRYPDIFRKTSKSKFRSPQDYAIPSMFANFYALAYGKAVEHKNVKNEYAYLDIGKKNSIKKYQSIISKKPMFFCLNATYYEELSEDEQGKVINEFLEKMYPFKSPFEL